MDNPKIALVHDWLTTYAGQEQCLLALHEQWPEAPIYTSIWDPSRTKPFAGADIRTSYLQKIPSATKRHQILVPLMPQAFEAFDLREYDIIVSISTGMSKGVIVHPHQRHICYMNTPPRYLWNFGGDSRTEGWIKQSIAHQMRIWDVVSANRVDVFVGNSHNVAKRIAKIYRRDAHVIYPPVDTNKFALNEHPTGDYFLSVGRLIDYKRVDVIIEGCKQAGVKLKIAGDGPQRADLERRAAAYAGIEFLGRVSDEQLADLYANTLGFVFAGEEDFGIVPVEAMAAGRPVIAFGRGGLTETVKAPLTGTFFYEQDGGALKEAITLFQGQHYDPVAIRDHALQFDTSVFQRSLQDLVDQSAAEI